MDTHQDQGYRSEDIQELKEEVRRRGLDKPVDIEKQMSEANVNTMKADRDYAEDQASAGRRSRWFQNWREFD